MIPASNKKSTIPLISEAVASGARKSEACRTLDISPRTLARWENGSIGDTRKGAVKRVFRKLTQQEYQEILDVACESRFKDLTPHEIVPVLAEEGRYIASESIFYRVLRRERLLNHRSSRRPKSGCGKPPELLATGPNQVWSWDITWLKSEVRGLFYYCYMIKDIWKKNIVGWEIHDHESDELAADMFKRLKTKYNLDGVRLHSDNGNPMKGATMLVTLHGLGVIPSFSRPRISNDNPFIESLFSTMKYMAGYPSVFKSLGHAREWMAGFVDWYNTVHRHSAIGFVTPQQRDTGEDIEIFRKRNKTIFQARMRCPERWVGRVREWKNLDVVVLNPDKKMRENTANVA
jgi:transposase InsO family protein